MPKRVKMTRPPSKAAITRLADLLGALGPGASLTSYWIVGRSLNAALGDRATYGSQALDKLQGRLHLSSPMLHQLRRMARVWTREDVREADRAGISLRLSGLLVGLDVLAGRLEPAETKKLKGERRRLVRRIGRSRPSYWQIAEEIRVLRARYDPEAGRHAKAKRIRMARSGIAKQVEDLVGRVHSLEASVDPQARKGLRRATGQIRMAGRTILDALAKVD